VLGLLGALLVSPPVLAAVPRVGIITVDGRASARQRQKIRLLITKLLERSRQVEVVSSRSFVVAARRARIPRSRWFRRRSLRRFGRRVMGMDFALTAQVLRRRRRLALRLYDLAAGRRVEARVVPIRNTPAAVEALTTAMAVRFDLDDLMREPAAPDSRAPPAMATPAPAPARPPPPPKPAPKASKELVLECRPPAPSTPAPAPAPGPRVESYPPAKPGSYHGFDGDWSEGGQEAKSPGKADRGGGVWDDSGFDDVGGGKKKKKEKTREQGVWAASGFDSVDGDSPDAVVEKDDEGASENLDDGEAKKKGIWSKLDATWGGRISFEHFSYFQSLGDDKVGGRNSGDIEVNGSLAYSWIKVGGAFLVRNDFSDDSRRRIDLTEGFVQARLGRLVLRGGRYVVSWGAANINNPADILCPVDLRDPLRAEKLPTYFVQASLQLGALTLDAYYLPVPEANLTPFFDGVDASGQPVAASRWLRPEMLMSMSSDSLPPGTTLPPMRFKLDMGEPPGIGTHQLALHATLAVWGFDISMGYAWLIDRNPTYRIKVSPAQNALDVDVASEHLRIHAVTAEVERAFGKLRIAAEGVAVMTRSWFEEAPGVRDSYFTWVLALDYQTGQFFHSHSMQFFLELSVTRALDGGFSWDPLLRVQHPFLRAVYFRTTYSWGQNLELGLNLVSGIDGYDLLINPEARYVLWDRLTLNAGAMFLIGTAAEGFFSNYHDNSRFIASAEFKF
jgi:hypothetical protein